MNVYSLLKLAFKAGINAGIVEAAHKADCLKDKQPGTFEEFIKLIEPTLWTSIDELKNLSV
jgi:hypothetical protein